jgi:hypothetical protein
MNGYRLMRWYAVVDDVTGGWAVATVDAPVSGFLGYGEGRAIADGIWEQELAEHIANRHNEWMDAHGF